VSATGSQRRYSPVAMTFHWVIAAAILYQIWLGWRMSDLPSGMAKFELFQLHKSVGITILLLSLGRLGWRLTHRPPPYAGGVRGWQHTLATAVHTGFYVMMIALPLTGWAAVSASTFNLPTVLWGVVPWPHLPGLAELAPGQKETVSGALGTTHEWLVRLTIAMLALHVAGALKHQFADKDGTLWRMLPFGRGPARREELTA
jgi:cytochrome b561